MKLSRLVDLKNGIGLFSVFFVSAVAFLLLSLSPCVAAFGFDGSVSGVVEDSATGQPLSGIQVVLMPYAYGYGLCNHSTITNESGQYEFTDVQRYTQSSGGSIYWATYKMFISVPGYNEYMGRDLSFSENQFHFDENAVLYPGAPNTIYVDCWATTSGDGTLLSPLRTINEAFNMASYGQRVYLHAGSYSVSDFIIPAGITLQGWSMYRTTLGGGIVSMESNSAMSQCNITAGIEIHDAENISITRCYIRGNIAWTMPQPFGGMPNGSALMIVCEGITPNIVIKNNVIRGYCGYNGGWADFSVAMGIFITSLYMADADFVNLQIVNNLIIANGDYQDGYAYAINGWDYINESPTNVVKNNILLEYPTRGPPDFNADVGQFVDDFSFKNGYGSIPIAAQFQSDGMHLAEGSVLVDAGDPADDYSNEPEPNGGRIDIGAFGNTEEATPTIYVPTPVAYAVVDDFNDADSNNNFLNLQTAAGRIEADGGDLTASYDIFGANPANPLNTAHQISWDGALGETSGQDDAFWYSFISNGEEPAIPVGDFQYLQFKVQLGGPDRPDLKRDMIAVDLQVNYPDGEIDQEGKPFRVYRAYQPVVNTEELDLVNMGFYDFFDEYNPSVRFTDNLAGNIANLRAIAIAAADHTDPYLTDSDGDGVDLGLDNYGTIFIEDVGFLNRSQTTTDTLFIDNFEDADPNTNLLGYSSQVLGATGAAEEDFAGSKRLRIDWVTSSQNTRFLSDVSNDGAQLLDISGYTHLAFDTICPPVDDADYYDVILVVVDPNGVTKEYSYGKALGSKRIQEEYIPLNRFRHGSAHYPASDRNPIPESYLTCVKEIKLFFGVNSVTTQGMGPLGSDASGTIWLDNLRLVRMELNPLYNYPPVITSIDGHDTTNDFLPSDPLHRKRYEKFTEIGQTVTFDVTAVDYQGHIASLTVDIPGAASPYTFDVEISEDQATGNFSWVPSLADGGMDTAKFTLIDDKGAKDIQEFVIIVTGATPAGWPIELPYGFQNAPAAIDLDGDGDLEIIAANEAYNADGTLVWSVPQANSVDGVKVAIGEITNSPGPEVVLINPSTEPGLWLVSAGGIVLGTYGEIVHDYFNCPVLADVDGDEYMEILVRDDPPGPTPPGEGNLMALKWNPATSTLEQLWMIEGEFLINPVPVDIDDNGVTDKIILRSFQTLYIYDIAPAGGAPVLDCEITWHSYGYDGPCVGDIDGDGEKEIVAEEDGYVSAYELDGSLVSGQWPYHIGTGDAYVALADLVQDDSDAVEVVLSVNVSGGQAPEHVMAIEGDGTLIFDLAEFPNPGGVVGIPAVADIDNDGQSEVIVSSGPEGDSYGDVGLRLVYVINAGGEIEYTLPPFLVDSPQSFWAPSGSPTITDLNKDGFVDIIIPASGELHLLTLGSGFAYDPDNMQWPMLGHDLRNSNNTGEIEPPQITIVTPSQGVTTTNRRQAFHAHVSDNVRLGLASLALDGAEIWGVCFVGQTGEVDVTPPAPLSYGWHTYQLTVTDMYGNVTTLRRQFKVVRIKPYLEIPLYHGIEYSCDERVNNAIVSQTMSYYR